MPTIDPFNFSPLGIFDSLHAYALCTWLRIQYWGDEGNSFYDNRIASIFGATDFQVLPRQVDGLFTYPRTDLATLGDGRRVVMIQGTNDVTNELVSEIFVSGLVHLDEWQGRVSNYFGLVARQTWSRLPVISTQWMIGGHSLGGAIAGLVGVHGAAKYFTAGQPREGDGVYADSRPNPTKLRLTNQRDPIPFVPRSSGTFLDFFDIDLPLGPLAQNYRHWGIRHHLWPDGSLTLPPNADSSELSGQQQSLNDLVSDITIPNHLAPEYCKRLRQRIPLQFPATKPDSDFPQIDNLDSLNFDMNAGDNLEQWVRAGPLPSGIPTTRRPPVPPGVPPNTDPYQFLCE